MSQIPYIKHPKKNLWTWVDNQLDKLMKANKDLIEENKRLKRYIETLESQVDELNHALAGRR